jgi:hypothetical protein
VIELVAAARSHLTMSSVESWLVMAASLRSCPAGGGWWLRENVDSRPRCVNRKVTEWGHGRQIKRPPPSGRPSLVSDAVDS